MNIFEIQEFDYEKRKRNLTSSSSGIVSSTKYFPVFEENKIEKIFKPLSKTKPLSTPLFAYSEVYWSYLINKYIDSTAPVYKLAYCYDLSKEQPKYYDKGCIVDNILQEGESLVNILELFRMYPDNSVDIEQYINYCEMQYDYTKILESTFFINNKELSRKLSEQILCSILRRDENYHYENVSLKFKNGKFITIAPIIDHEFSQMFMYPDLLDVHEENFSRYDEGMQPIFNYNKAKTYEENIQLFIKIYNEGSIYDNFDRYKNYLLIKNIKTIVSLHPDLVLKFVEKINKMKEEVKNLNIIFDSTFLGRFSSDDWQPTRMILKDNIKETDERYIRTKQKVESTRIILDENEFNKRLKKEVLWNIDKITNIINLFININNNEYGDLKLYKNNTLYKKVDRYPEHIMELFLDDTIENNKNKSLRNTMK